MSGATIVDALDTMVREPFAFEVLPSHYFPENHGFRRESYFSFPRPLKYILPTSRIYLPKGSTSLPISTSARRKRRTLSGMKTRFLEECPDGLRRLSVFESTIRYIGGLLSAYELSDKEYPALVTKAKQLADKLTFAWIGVRCNESALFNSLNYLRTTTSLLDTLTSAPTLFRIRL